MKPEETLDNPIKPGEIIQIVPGHPLGRCLLMVTDTAQWGCVACIQTPTDQYDIALDWADFERCGGAVKFR